MYFYLKSITTKLSLSLVLLSALFGDLSSASTAKPKIKKNPNSFSVNGKAFKIKSLSEVTVKVDEAVTKPEGYTALEHAKLQMPSLLAGPSSISPTLPNISALLKLPPLIRYSLKVNWSGLGETRLIPEWTIPSTPETPPTVSSMESITDGEFHILEALMLLRNQDTTPIAMGLANPLLKFESTRGPAHEILGRSQLALKIRTAALEHFNELLKTDKELSRMKRGLNFALGALNGNDYDESKRLTSYVQKLTPEDKDLGNFSLAQARTSIEQKDLQKAWDQLSHVPAESSQDPEARFLRAMIYYRSNQVAESRKEFEALLALADKIPKDLKSLTAGTLAQIYFQQGDYKSAFNTYRLVEQEHPIWMETLVESAWSQILNKDYEGAAGNMFSLHTTYFKGAYKPESYIVRTVSYLQLCQFGDALSVLKDFLRKYKFAQKQLQAYKAQNPNHLEIVRDFLKAGMPKKFAGLPRSLLVEIARDPKFIELQKRLNEQEEDAAKLAQMGTKLDELDRSFLDSQNKYTKLLQDLEGHIKKVDDPTKKESLLAERKSHEKHIERFALLRKIILDAKAGVNNENQTMIPIWANRKTSIKSDQNEVLKSSFASLEKDLSHWLDQSELLFYEIHNGAGEHLRYQMATNSGETRSPANENPKLTKEDKDLQWAFDGEIWEDEVGHYRSSLKNVCPENEGRVVGKKNSPAEPTVANTSDGN